MADSQAQDGAQIGLVAMLVTDRDADVVGNVLQHLNKALAPLVPHTSTVDMLVSLRPCDTAAKTQCQRHCPEHLRRMEFVEVEYDAEFRNHYHEQDVLQAICMQRNLLRRMAMVRGVAWLLFLDSDVLLNADTITRLLSCGQLCVGAPYMPRWSRHVIVGLASGDSSRGETELQLLVNPQLLQVPDHAALPCSVLGFGATLVRQPLLSVQFRVAASMGGVEGEDIGFCLDLLSKGIRQCHPHFLTEHAVQHLSGGARPKPFVPYLGPQSCALSTHFLTKDLFEVEADLPLQWRVETTDKRSAVTPEEKATSPVTHPKPSGSYPVVRVEPLTGPKAHAFTESLMTNFHARFRAVSGP